MEISRNGNHLASEREKLKIVMQGAVSEENILTKSGAQKQVHVVVKNVAFPIELSSNVDLTKCRLEAKLIYDFDNDGDEKVPVSYVKNEPLEYRILIQDGGLTASLELRIKVLTSQHEDMLFRCQIVGTENATDEILEVFSHPIKVISKLNQLKRRDPALSVKKRVTNDSIADVLSRIENQQSSILNQIHENQMHLFEHTAKLAADIKDLFHKRDSGFGQSELDQVINMSNDPAGEVIQEETIEEGDNKSFTRETNNHGEDIVSSFLEIFKGLRLERKREIILHCLEYLDGFPVDKIIEYFETNHIPLKKRQKVDLNIA